MTSQAEIQPTINDSGEDSALRPEVTRRFFDGMFDEYVRILNDPFISHTFDTKKVDNDNQPIFETLDNVKIAQMKLAELHDYAKGSMISGDLQFDAQSLPRNGLVTFDSICEAYVNDGVLKAIERREQSQPDHIRVSQHDPNPKITHAFMEIIEKIKDPVHSLGIDVMLGKIGLGPTNISEPLQIVQRDAEALNDDLTGREITVTLSSVKPN